MMGQCMREAKAPEFNPTLEWSELRRRLARLALALTRSRDDADDLVQQTVVVLLTRNPDLADHAGYARRAMLRVWMDQHRSTRRRLSLWTRVAQGRMRWRTDTDRLAASDRLAQVRRAIELLPPIQRAVVVLRLIEGLQYKGIAGILECSVQTVRANLHAARTRIKQILGEDQ